MAEISLASVREEASKKPQNFSVKDFASEDEIIELKKAQIERRRRKRKFDDASAYSAEVLARFGYEAWKAWQEGDLPTERMNSYLLAERAREDAKLLNFEAFLMPLICSTIRKAKSGTPKGVRNAQKVIKEQIERAKGY